ncbi:MAG: oligosaccharide flippase family protein [Bacteroidota bacterium]
MRGALAAFTVRALGIVVAYLVQVLLACWTGSTQYGLYVYAWTWLTVLAMVVPIGLNEAILRFVPTYIADEKWDELRGIVERCPLLIAIIGALTAAVGSLIVGLVPDLADSAFAPPLIIALWTTPFMAVLVFLEGMGRALGSVTMAYAPRNVGVPLLVLLASGIWILVDPALTARRVVVVLLSSSVFFVVLQSFMVRSQLPKEVSLHRSAHPMRKWLRVALPLMIVSLATLLNSYIDVIVIGFFLSPEDVGVYNAAWRTALLVWGAPQALSVLAAPLIGRLYAAGNKTELRSLMATIIQGGFWPSLVAAAVFIVFGQPILSLFGDGFGVAYASLVVLVLGQLTGAAAGPVDYLLGMTRHHDRLALIHAVTCIFCIVLTLALVPVLGIIGAAIAKSAITVGINLWMVVDARARTGITSVLFHRSLSDNRALAGRVAP